MKNRLFSRNDARLVVVNHDLCCFLWRKLKLSRLESGIAQALAGRLIVPKGGSLMGQVDYNGSSGKGLELSRLVGFVHQRDAHLAALTVRETLTFAHLCQSVRIPPLDNPSIHTS